MIRYRVAQRGVLKYDDAVPGDQGVPIQPEDGAAWQAYHDWMNDNHCGPDPMLVPPPPPATPYDGHNFIAAGRARDQRQLEKLARTDPLQAALKAGGLA